jgi:hypothetical protein
LKNTALLILKIILLAQAVFWLAQSIYYAAAFGLGAIPYIIVTALTLLDAAAFAALALLLKYWRLPVRLLILLFLLANTALTFTDQVGVWDYIILVLNLGALVCLSLAAIPFSKK